MCSAASPRKRGGQPSRFWSAAFPGKRDNWKHTAARHFLLRGGGQNCAENGARPAIKTASAAKRPERKREPAGTGRGVATSAGGNLLVSSACKQGEICRSVSRQCKPTSIKEVETNKKKMKPARTWSTRAAMLPLAKYPRRMSIDAQSVCQHWNNE